jgi:hypothetical protein
MSLDVAVLARAMIALGWRACSGGRGSAVLLRSSRSQATVQGHLGCRIQLQAVRIVPAQPLRPCELDAQANEGDAPMSCQSDLVGEQVAELQAAHARDVQSADDASSQG